MSSVQDENIELVEFNSPSPTKSYIKKKLKNRVGSPPGQTPVRSVSKKQIEPEVFIVQSQRNKPTLTPLKKNLKQKPERKHKSWNDITSESITTSDEITDSNDPESWLSNKSESRSYKERLRERFEMVKQKAGKSVTKAHRTYEFKEEVEKVTRLSKSLGLMKKENDKIEAELQGYERQRTSRSTQIDAYNFFCNEIQPAPDDLAGESQEEVETNLDKSMDVLVNISRGEEDTLTEMQSAEQLQLNLKFSEADLFWLPPRSPLELHEKAEGEPRFLANEGFFVQLQPDIQVTKLNTLEHRLLGNNNTIWFNCEGQLKMLQNPCTKTFYRPYSSITYTKEIEANYMPATTANLAECEQVLVPQNILEIHVSTLKFKHHPLFSAEHIFQEKLITLYDKHQHNHVTNKLLRLSKRLDALQAVKTNYEEILQASGDSANKDFQKLQYKIEEIQSLRNLIFEEGKKEREAIKLILQTWKNIKKIREINGYANTCVKLVIQKEKSNHEEDRQNLDVKIEQMTSEIISELEFDYKCKVEKYKKELAQWKQQTLVNVDEMPTHKKPKKPSHNVDADEVKEEVQNKFKESFKPAGEPHLHFDLTYENVISSDSENPKEKLRKHTVTTTKVYLRLVCNSIEICKSKPVLLSDDFECAFNELFSIQLVTLPDYVFIEIHEQPSTLFKRKLGQIQVRLPSQNFTLAHNKLAEEQFVKEEIIHYKHEGIGSGIELAKILKMYDLSEISTNEVLYTSGIVGYNCGWDVNIRSSSVWRNLHSDVPDAIQSVLNDDGTINAEKLVEWCATNNPDPQDPKNSVLFDYVRNYEDIHSEPRDSSHYFRYNPGLAPLEFCEQNEIDGNLRFQILQLRNNNEPEFVDMVIPNRIKEIPTNILEAYKKRVEEHSKANALEENDVDTIDAQRSRGKKFLKQVHIKVFQQCRSTQHNLTFEDVVNEKSMFQIEAIAKSISTTLQSWFQFQPAVSITVPRVIQKKPEPKITNSKISTPVHILIHVISAVNIPLRTSSQTASRNRSISEESTGIEVVVKPFVTVQFENVRVQTSTLDGQNPIWNEELAIPLEASNVDYLSPNSLNGSILLNVFDEIAIEGGRSEDNSRRNWLGSVRIPLSAVCCNTKMEGLFKINAPIARFGYEQEQDRFSTGSRASAIQDSCVQSSYLSLKIQIQTHIPKLTPSMDELPSNELPSILQHILVWNESYNSSFPNRKFSPLVIDINGKTTCITRYIRPLEPPQLNSDGFDVTAEQCARYVSMIPFSESNKFYQNICLSTQQLLKLTIGTVTDHAIALTCYFLSLEIETWLLLGYGIPNGYNAYVLIREYTRETQMPLHYIYDVVSAEKYNVTDPFCPLQKVFCVVHEDNIWANVQRTDELHLTRFDFTRRSDWLALLNNEITAPTISVQQKLTYSLNLNIDMLETRIDKKIRKKIMKLRTHERTIWNHYVSKTFKAIAAKLENNYAHGRARYEIQHDMRNITGTYHVILKK